MPEKGISQLVAVDLQKAERYGGIILKCQNIRLKNRLEIAKSKISKKNLYKNKEPPFIYRNCLQIKYIDLVSAVVIGTIIGFILDKTFGTKPWLILIFFFVGVVAGIVNVFRSAKNMQK